MAKYFVEDTSLIAISDAIRSKTGGTEKLTLEQMAESIEHLSTEDDTQTYILVDEDGYEIPAVLVDEPVELTATTNDIRRGTTAVTEAGVVTGEKEIPIYHTREGKRIVTNGNKFVLPAIDYDYTSLQAIICPFNKTTDGSVSAERVAIEDSVYDVLSTEPVSAILKDTSASIVDLGITNDSGKIYIIRYFMYKEIY